MLFQILRSVIGLLCLNCVLVSNARKAVGPKIVKPKCCFPKKLEGFLYLTDKYGPMYFQNARFAVDYVKGRAIIRHPGKDNIFILQDLKTDIKYERLSSGECLQTELQEEEKIMECVPGEANPIALPQMSKIVDIVGWLFKRSLAPAENGTEVRYVSVMKSNCLPMIVERFENNETRSKTERYVDLKTKIANPKILEPVIDDCVQLQKDCSAANSSYLHGCPFLMLILSLSSMLYVFVRI